MKTYSVIHGYEKKAGIIEIFMRYHNLEKFPYPGFFPGVATDSSGSQCFLPLDYFQFRIPLPISTAIISLVLIVTGIQIFLFAVFQSMMLLNENHPSDQVTK